MSEQVFTQKHQGVAAMNTLMPRNGEAFAAFHEYCSSFPAIFFLPSKSPVCLPYFLKKENHPGLAPHLLAWDGWTVTHLCDLLDLWRRHVLGKASQFLSHVLSHRVRALRLMSLDWKEACVGCFGQKARLEPEDPQDGTLPSHSWAGWRLCQVCGGRATTMLQLSIGKQQDARLAHQVAVT